MRPFGLSRVRSVGPSASGVIRGATMAGQGDRSWASVGSAGRNDPCGRGSGRKVKRSCGVRRGPGPDELAKAFLAEQGHSAAQRLVGITRDEFADMLEEVIRLPEVDLALHVELPALMTWPPWR